MTKTKLKKLTNENTVDFANSAIKLKKSDNTEISFGAYKIDSGIINVKYTDKNNKSYKYTFYNDINVEDVKAISFINIADDADDTAVAKHCFYAFQVRPYNYNDIGNLSFYNYKDDSNTKLTTIKPIINNNQYAYCYYGLNKTHDKPIAPGKDDSQFLLGSNKCFNYNIDSSKYIKRDDSVDKENRYKQIGFYTMTYAGSSPYSGESMNYRQLYIYNPYNYELDAKNIQVVFNYIEHGEKRTYTYNKGSIPAYGYVILNSIGECLANTEMYTKDTIEVSESNPITINWRFNDTDDWNTYKITDGSYSHYVEVKGVDTKNKTVTIDCNQNESGKFYYLYDITTGTKLEAKYITNSSDGTKWNLSSYTNQSFLISEAPSWTSVFNDFDTYKTVYVSFDDWDNATALEDFQATLEFNSESGTVYLQNTAELERTCLLKLGCSVEDLEVGLVIKKHGRNKRHKSILFTEDKTEYERQYGSSYGGYATSWNGVSKESNYLNIKLAKTSSGIYFLDNGVSILRNLKPILNSTNKVGAHYSGTITYHDYFTFGLQFRYKKDGTYVYSKKSSNCIKEDNSGNLTETTTW